MPTFSAFAFDRLIEPSVNDKPLSDKEQKNQSKEGKPTPLLAFASPTLYTTPQTTAIPYVSPSFTASPYVLNHKRRRPPPCAVQKIEAKDAPRQNGFHVVNGAQECDNESRVNDENRENGEISVRDEKMVNGEIRVRDENRVNGEISVPDGNKVTGKGVLRENDSLNQEAKGVLSETDAKFSPVTENTHVKKEHKGLKKEEAKGPLKEIDLQCGRVCEKTPVEDGNKLKLYSSPGAFPTPREYLTSRETSMEFVPANGSACVRRIAIPGRNEDETIGEQNEAYEYNSAEGEVCSESNSEEVFQRSPGDVDCTPRTTRSVFFDAEDDLSTEDLALQNQTSESYNSRIQCEIDALRSKMYMEIERSMRAEEALSLWQNQWQEMLEKFSLIGLSLPSIEMSASSQGEKAGLIDFADDVCGQLAVARMVAHAVGRGSLRAELDQELKMLIDSKDFEISRLRDKLQYYELVNREMSQRNQEAIELGRRRRRAQKKRQKWIWSSLAISIAIGTTAVAYTYIPWAEIKDWASSTRTQSDIHGMTPDHVEI